MRQEGREQPEHELEEEHRHQAEEHLAEQQRPHFTQVARFFRILLHPSSSLPVHGRFRSADGPTARFSPVPRLRRPVGANPLRSSKTPAPEDGSASTVPGGCWVCKGTAMILAHMTHINLIQSLSLSPPRTQT